MPLIEHLIELRKRLVISGIAFIVVFIACYYFAEDIYVFLQRPLVNAQAARGQEAHMIFTGAAEMFFTLLKVSGFAAAFICFPIFAGQLWAFIAPGLYKNEKRAFLPFLFATPVLFIAGAATVYFIVLPMALRFFLSFEISADLSASQASVELTAKVDEYLSLVMHFIFAFGLAYQMPVLFTLLARVGLVTAQALIDKRRYAIVGVFVAAAILTPPDILSQLCLAAPMLVLYEVSIFCCKLVERQQARENAAEPVAAGAEPSEPDVDETDFNDA